MFKHLLIFPLILLCSEMAVFLSTDMYLPALPDIMREFNVSSSLVQLTLSTWFLGSMSMQLFVGPASDRFGRRPVFMMGIILFVVSTFFCAISTNIWMLAVARFFQGCTVCFIIVPGYASIHELYDQKNSVKLLATMSSISVLAPALGPFLGGLLSTFSGWRWIFLSLFVWGMLMMGWIIMRMPETLAADKRTPLNLSTVLRHYKSIISNWQFMHYLLTYGSIFGGFMSWLVCGPFLVTAEFQYKPLFFGIFQMMIFGFYMLANRLVKWLINKFELYQLIEMGLFVSFSGSVFSITSAFMYPEQLIGLIIGMMLFAFGFGISSGSLQRLTIESSDAPMGSRMAILSICLGISGLLSSLTVSFFYNGTLNSLASIIMGSSIISAALYFSGRRYHGQSVDDTEPSAEFT